MYYVNFDDNITAKYGIVLENWPLKKLCSPADIGSQNEVKVVLNAFKSGATCFRKLSEAEFEQWGQRRFEARMAVMGTSASDANDGSHGIPSPGIQHSPVVSSSILSGQTSIVQQDPIDNLAPPLSINFVNSVTTLNGNPLAVGKRARKPRSDKGKPRGPRKSKITSHADPTDASMAVDVIGNAS
jgi:hypothetical protein